MTGKYQQARTTRRCKISKNCLTLKILLKNYDVHSKLKREETFFTLKTLCVNYFVNLKIEWLQKIKTTSFIKLAIVTRSLLR